jgi:cytochrome b6-f complex iron-sulfur subunit
MMAIIHDDVGRRRFLSQAVMGFGLLFGMSTLAMRFFQFLVPSRQARRYESVLIGNESLIPLGGAIPMELGGQKILVLRTNEGVAAFSRRCTDLGCLVSWNREREEFLCPCHQGVFDKTGQNIAGPPPRPLDRFQIVKKGEQLYVNVTIA